MRPLAGRGPACFEPSAPPAHAKNAGAPRAAANAVEILPSRAGHVEALEGSKAGETLHGPGELRGEARLEYFTQHECLGTAGLLHTTSAGTRFTIPCVISFLELFEEHGESEAEEANRRVFVSATRWARSSIMPRPCHCSLASGIE